MIHPRLFDEMHRSDGTPCAETEDSFSFLNRVDTPYWAEVRQLLEEWFARYPNEGAESLRSAFRSELPGRHWAAWWELYLHQLFCRLGYQISLHPALPDSHKRPDFELQRNDSRLLVEATVVFSGIHTASEESDSPPSWLLSAINEVRSPGFFLHFISLEKRGTQQLKVSDVRGPLEAWLAGLDPDQVASKFETDGEFPETRVECRGWAMTFSALPVKAEARGKTDHKVLGVQPIQVGYVDDVGQFESKLKSKAGLYGRPDVPLVTAVLSMSAFMDRLDIEQALYGREAFLVSPDIDTEPSATLVRQRNGFWVRRDGTQNKRVSAVLTGIGIQPWSVSRAAPELWLNPWADYPLQENWPFVVSTVNDSGAISYSETSKEPSAFFDLTPDWPGDKPFPRD